MLLPVHKDTKLLIFDCDGTIANNMHIHTESWQSILSNIDVDIAKYDIAKYNGLPSEFILKDLLNFDDNQIQEISDRIKEATYALLSHTKPIKPIIDLIKHYHGKLPMLVISGGKKSNVFKTLEVLELVEYFEEIITADDDHPSKSSPQAFSILAEKYNVKNHQCHVFEDGVIGLINALQAGMTVTDIRNIDLE